jgi:hypothetical protein
MEHTSVADEQSIPEHNSNLNEKQKIPFPVFPRIDVNVAFYLRNINQTTRHISLCLTIMPFSNIICDFVRFCEIFLYIERKLCTRC